jgi:putative flippase GtrA
MARDVPSSTTGSAGTAILPDRGPLGLRFTKYSSLSLITVPVGYAVLLLTTQVFPTVNAGLLNFAVGTVLTPPSFLLYRILVWKGGSGRSVWYELLSFWQTVLVGAIASSVLIGAADTFLNAGGPLIILAGLIGQGIVFLARFVWLDKVTFTRPALAAEGVEAE